MACSSNSVKTCSILSPSSASTTRRMLENGSGRARSWSSAQLLDDVGRNDVRPRRHQLPELDERGPELVEHVPEPSAPRPGHLRCVGGRLGGRPAQQLPEAVARGDLRNLTDAREVLAPL